MTATEYTKEQFYKLSQDQLKAIPDEIYRNIPGGVKNSCADCGHIVEAVHLWCGSADAGKARGTRIPGVIKCQFWIPEKKIKQISIKKNLSWWKRLFNYNLNNE